MMSAFLRVWQSLVWGVCVVSVLSFVCICPHPCLSRVVLVPFHYFVFSSWRSNLQCFLQLHCLCSPCFNSCFVILLCSVSCRAFALTERYVFSRCFISKDSDQTKMRIQTIAHLLESKISLLSFCFSPHP